MSEYRQTAEQLFAGNSEMAMLMRSHDWSKTSLGAVENWSQSLKTAVRIVLTSSQAMFIWWGEELINLYNDAYRSVLGGKHPQALGQPAANVWREIWDQVGPRVEYAMLHNEGTYDEALLLIMERNGYPEETYYTFSYSPIPDHRGNPGGIICACTEDTERAIGARQLALLRELAARTADARTFDEACTLSAKCLQTNLYDLPFAMIYLVDQAQQSVVLAGTSGIDASHPAVPETVEIDSDSIWSFAEVIQTQKPVLIKDLETKFSNLPTGAWDRVPHQAVVVAIAPSGSTGRSGILVAGLNPFRLFDDNYRSFIDLVAAQISASVANANAYEEERKRAEALAEIDRAKTLFFTNVSHEFRTPLTLMLSPLEELSITLDQRLQPDEREQLNLVQRNGLRLQKLVNTLLDFSRIEAGRIQAVYEPTDLATYTTELASAFRSLIEQAGMSLIVDCPPLPEAIYVDRQMWEKIVLNLLSNAFKFTLNGSIAVKMTWEKSQVKLSIVDTGVGISPADLPNLFKRFHRVENSQGRSFEGSGIGLSLVQELVKLHGGTIDVTSVVGQGSCFTVSIPTGFSHLPKEQIGATRTMSSTALGVMSYVEEAQRWLPEESSEFSILSFELEENSESNNEANNSKLFFNSKLKTQNSKLLLADDNADMRDYIQRLLSSTYTVETVADGMAALSYVQKNPPDLVLSDVMMPKMDGFELLRQLRSEAKTKEIPIILLSARAGEEARIEGLEAGADDYLIKPFSARELLARIEATLKLSKLRQEALQQEQKLRTASEIAQQRAEAAFRRIDQLLESMTDAFIALDKDWRIIYQNAAAERINGNKPRSEVLGKTLWEEWPAAVGSISDRHYRLAIAQQVPVHFEQHYYEPPDHDVYLEVHAYPLEEGLGIFYRDISDRKRYEQALRESEEQSRNILESITDGFFALDQNWRFTYANRQADRLLDRTPGDLLGKVLWEEYPGLAGSEFERAYRQAASEGVASSVTSFYPDHDRWYEVHAYPAPNGIAVYFRNVTQRMRAEETLRRSEERYRTLFESIDEGFCVIEMLFDQNDKPIDYRFLEVNPSFEQQTGFKQAEGKTMRQLVPNLEDSWFEIYGKVALTGEPIRFENRVEAMNRWFDVYAFRIGQAQERKLAILFNDISDRKRIEATLVEREARLRLIIESAKDYAIFTLDLQGQITSWNVGAQRLLGYEEAEILGQNGSIIFTREDIALGKPEEERQNALTRERAENERWHVRKDGSRYWGSGLMMPLREQDGSIRGFLKIMQDKTAQRQAEQEREQLLAREQAAREQAETANRIKDEFLAVLSHELRTPLNPILGWSSLLQRGTLDAAKMTHALKTIDRNAKLQAQLIDDLLDISRILRGKLALNVAPIDLNAVIGAALETVRLAAEAKSLHIETDFNPSVGLVMGDAGRLQQVVWNLLSNAVKFTPSGGQIKVELTQVGTNAQIQIKDTGKGIHPDFLPYVFEHFRQEDGATTRKFGGLGLGLAIARQIVEMHGGTIRAHSAGENLGATFTVSLPCLNQNPQQPDSTPRESNDANSNLNGLKLLVVDDDPDSLEFLSFVLSEQGANAIAVSSAQAALQVLEQSDIDLIVSDIGMPELDGYTLMQQIRSKGNHIPAIALTAYAGEGDRQLALAAGYQNHLAKPVDTDALLAIVVNLIK